MGRISIAGLLGWVVVCAMGFAALVNASDLWLGATLALTIAVLLGSLLVLLLRGWRGGGWLGFALFGWGYFLLSLPPVGLNDHFRQLSDPLARWAFDSANPQPIPPPNTPSTGMDAWVNYRQAAADFRHRRANAGVIGQWLTVPLLGMFGAVAGSLLARARPADALPLSPR